MKQELPFSDSSQNLTFSSPEELASQFKKQQITAACHAFQRSLRNSRDGFLLRKFIDIFCEPENAPIPVTSTQAGQIELGEIKSLSDIPVAKWLQSIDPQRVRPQLLKDLGIPFSSSKIGQNEIPVISSEVVKGLISFFKGLRAFPKLHDKNSPNATSYPTTRFWVASGNDNIKLNGKFIHFGSRPKILTKSDGKQIQARDISLYSSLDACLRAKRYQDKSSRAEIQFTLKVASDSSSLGERLWNFAYLNQEEREAALKRISDLITQTADKYPILIPKKITKERILSSDQALDKNGRTNPPATALKLDAAASGSNKRIAKVHETLIRNNYDALKFEELSFISQNLMLNAYQHLLEKGDSLQPMFNYNLKSNHRIQQVDNFFEHIGLGKALREQFYFRPYSTFIAHIDEIREEMKLVAGSNDLSKGRHLQDKLLSFLYCASTLHPALSAVRDELKKESLQNGKAKLFDYCNLILKALENPIKRLALAEIGGLDTQAKTVALKLGDKIIELKRRAALLDIESLLLDQIERTKTADRLKGNQ